MKNPIPQIVWVISTGTAILCGLAFIQHVFVGHDSTAASAVWLFGNRDGNYFWKHRRINCVSLSRKS
jgi:hypothetical protein